jgi:2-amino-4-hydroxy-6-hydroxymethyldihydropteridine diphosphokinase
MNLVFLSLGSNQGNRIKILNEAIDEIASKVGKIHLVSSCFETEPWGYMSKNNFINQVISLYTTMTPDLLLNTLHEIERKFGRHRPSATITYSDRPIDIDILFYNQQVIELPALTIPHGQFHIRRFVLEPMNEIAPDFVHPVYKKTINQLLNVCIDQTMVYKAIMHDFVV